MRAQNLNTKSHKKTNDDAVKAAQKNPKAFGLLYEQNYYSIFRFVYNRVDSAESAADIVSEVFLKALKNIKKYKIQGTPFSSWLYQIARNEVNMHYRQSNKSKVVSLNEESIHAIFDEAEIEPDTSELFIAFINQLDDDETEMVEMKFFEQRSHEEIASILKISKANSKVKLHRIIKKLKAYYNEK
ncbi:MAG: sigma-70 family RNA polymerase sigma factor [Flavobacteriales bacterium]|nr:sigma-70 family RNA polymerase sigma factor [Flavobacteriales bacterium]